MLATYSWCINFATSLPCQGLLSLLVIPFFCSRSYIKLGNRGHITSMPDHKVILHSISKSEEEDWLDKVVCVPKLVELSCGYRIYVLNLKPLNVRKVFPCQKKSTKFFSRFPCFPCFPWELWEGLLHSLSNNWAVLKIRYFRPCNFSKQCVGYL